MADDSLVIPWYELADVLCRNRTPCKVCQLRAKNIVRRLEGRGVRLELIPEDE